MPKVPVGRNKRRMPDNPTPEMLKRMRLDSEGMSANSQRTDRLTEPEGSHVIPLEDDEEEQSMNFAPGGDADYFAEEDGEGRFYGGGLTNEQKDILNIFDQVGGEEAREDVSNVVVVVTISLILRLD